MIKLLLPFLSFLLFTSSAQVSSNRAYHSGNGRAYKIVGLDGNFYFCTERYTPYHTDPTDIVSVDRTGTERFRLPVIKGEKTTITDMVTTRNRELLAVGYGEGCDTGLNPGRFLLRLDTSGNKIFYVEFDLFRGNYFEIKIAETPDGEIYLGKDSCLYHFDSTGTLQSKKNLGFGGITAISVISNTQLILCANKGGTKSIVIDTSGSVLSSISSGVVKRFMKTSSGRIMAYTKSGTVEKLASGLASKSVHNIAAGTIDAVIKTDTIYCITGDHRYNVYDTSFSVLHTYSLSVPLRTVNSLAVVNGDVGFLSNGGSFSGAYSIGAQNGSHPAFTRFRKGTGFSYFQDIGVIAAACDSCGPYGQYGGYFYRLKVKVKNYSTDTVKSFYLNSARFDDQICGREGYHQKFTGHFFAPGDTIEVTTNLFYFYHPSSGAMGIFSSAPNGEIDNVAYNDKDPTGLQQQSTVFGLSCYPNPVNDILNWEADKEIHYITINTMDGRITKSISVNAFSGQIDVEDLERGVYLITFSSGLEKAVKKLIKD